MSRFFKWMIDPRFLTVVGLIALSLVIWFGADYVRFGEKAEPASGAVRLVVILCVWFVATIIFLIKMLGQRKQNNSMVEAIQEEAKPSASDEEARVVGERFREAMSLLRTAKFDTKAGRRSVYQLPWYIIIGPPGAGKTTALINSGLHFPLKEKLGLQQIGGVGGTRNCDWWFTDEAVLIDTAGRYTTQDSDAAQDRTGWRNFLALLKKHRMRRPINGVLLAVSVQDLLSSSEAERLQHAERIRNRIQELAENFQVRFPIYFLFTKADLISGFNEFFENLGATEREKVWGMTFPNTEDQNASQTAEYFAPEFEALVKRLNERVIWRAHQERDTRRRSKILAFPGQVENMRSVLDSFIKSVFKTSRFEKQSLLRGVYFTSGTQEGRPIDRILANLSSNYGINYNVAANAPGAGKSFFLNKLLKEVIFPEAEIATLNTRYEGRIKWTRRVAFFTLLLAFGGALAAWTSSVVSTQNMMAEIQELLNKHNQLASANPEPNEFEQVLDILKPLEDAQQLYSEVDHPWLSNLGLYDAGVVTETEKTFDASLRHFLTPLLRQRLEGVLVTEDNNDAIYEALRVYLMMGNSRVRDNNEIKAWFARYWEEKLPGKASEQGALKTHLNQVLGDNFTDLTLKDTVVERSREKLRTIPIERRIYQQIKRQPEFAGFLNLRDDLGVDFAGTFVVDSQVSSDLKIPRLYTKAGYGKLDLSPDSNLVKRYSSEQWILGAQVEEDFSEKDVENIVEKIKHLYFTDYIDVWNRALNSPKVVDFGSMDVARNKLANNLDRTQSPILTLLNRASKETLLTPPLPDANVSGRAGQALDAAANLVAQQREPTPVDDAFKSLHRLMEDKEIDRYWEKLRGIFDKLEETSLAPNSSEAAFKFALARFSGGEDPVKALRVTASRAPGYLKGWLESMGDQSWKVLLGAGGSHLSAAWNREVYSVYQKTLAKNYPFSSRSSSDASLSDFAAFFKPGGIEDSFVKANVAPFITSSWRAKGVDGRGIGISSQALQQMQVADSIRRVFFGDKGEDPHVRFQVKPHKLDNTVRRFDFEVGSQRLRYTHGPQLKMSMDWPADKSGARVVFEDLNETLHTDAYEGDWGLFRLLDAHKVNKGSTSRLYNVVISVDHRNGEMELFASSTVNPFTPGWIKRYDCPSGL
ncbi:type VI secretion system membrane subunit TssM [Hahella sp. KA22]|uniref:type VI secretion system membrane subunit TssM n=1 Tax=Hahella sp. KA22 TaxID=1628392 RepID=UPI000FDE7CB9|nr:type VI secretion system membrane subunit TssM [Hahella sp. KA22]AZZ93191.1 type VI secretion system membrane subunit TssM [Hahella sp. KA22]QAY56564.1 type VI secretion system membrane subunit TssM [Hahella sp. KA22]